MCIFCNNEIEKIELDKCFIEKCNNCNSKITILKNNGNIIVNKFSKYDKKRKLLLFSPFLVIVIFIFSIIFGRINENFSTENAIKILLIGLIIFISFYIYCCINNLINYNKRGFMYSGLISLVKKDENKTKIFLSKIQDYFMIVFGTLTIITLCRLVLNNLIL